MSSTARSISARASSLTTRDDLRARICGESVRTWLACTFHGVTARWLPSS
ncbi:MAG TPA: hypothetical protein VGO62_12275 [Myxococcota bacterium]|jgi:hypothetical protein